MSRRLLELLWIAAAIVAVAVLLNLVPSPVAGQAPPRTRRRARRRVPPPKPRGARPTCRASGRTPTKSRCSGPRASATRKSFTDEEIAELDKQRTAILEPGQPAPLRRAASRTWEAPTTPPSSSPTSRPAGGRRSSSTRRTGAFRQ